MNVIHFPSLWLNNLPQSSTTRACLAQDDKTTLLTNLSGYVHSKAYELSFPSDGSSWAILSPIEQSIKEKIERYGTPLKEWGVEIKRGILTGLTEAFIIDNKTKDCLIAQDSRSAEIIRPILRGRDIKRYGYSFAGNWVILVSFGAYKTLQQQYPAIYQRLLSFKAPLEKRGQCKANSWGRKGNRDYPGQHHWLELDNNPSQEYLSLFNKPKIVYPEITGEMRACLVEEPMFVNNKAYIVTGKFLEWILVFLNSPLFQIINKGVNSTGGKGPAWFMQLSVPFNPENTSLICDLINRKEIKKAEAILYSTCRLTKEEIMFLEKSFQ